MKNNEQKTMETTPYENDKNYATWALSLWLNNDYPAYRHFAREREKVATIGRLKNDIKSLLRDWIRGEKIRYEELDTFAQGIIGDWLTNGVSWCNWTRINNVLQGEQEMPVEVDQLTRDAHALLARTNWREIIQGCEYRVDEDEKLRNALEDQVDAWVQHQALRTPHLQVHQFALDLFEHYLSAVDWEDVRAGLIIE